MLWTVKAVTFFAKKQQHEVILLYNVSLQIVVCMKSCVAMETAGRILKENVFVMGINVQVCT